MPKPLDDIVTEGRNPASADLDRLGAAALVQLMLREDRGVAAAVAAAAAPIAAVIDAIAAGFARGGRLIYVGAGTSGRLGVLDAAECPPTFCSPPGQVVGVIAGGAPALVSSAEGAEDDRDGAREELLALGLGAADVVVGIAASGRTPYVVGALEQARAAGATTVALACVAGSPLAAVAAVAIEPVVGPEVLTGSTRLKAGTATKMVLNMLSTGAMARTGKTYRNLMVDVQPTNAKLRARAVWIVCEVSGLAAAAADQLLDRCGGEVKTSLIAHARGVAPGEARRLLAAAGGRVRDLLEGGAEA